LLNVVDTRIEGTNGTLPHRVQAAGIQKLIPCQDHFIKCVLQPEIRNQHKLAPGLRTQLLAPLLLLAVVRDRR